jgi:hypothetical protein
MFCSLEKHSPEWRGFCHVFVWNSLALAQIKEDKYFSLITRGSICANFEDVA